MSPQQVSRIYLDYFTSKYIEAVDAENQSEIEYWRRQIKKEKEAGK